MNAVGLAISIVGALLPFQHTTSEYQSAAHAAGYNHVKTFDTPGRQHPSRDDSRQYQDVGPMAVAYLGLILLGVCISVTGVAVLLQHRPD